MTDGTEIIYGVQELGLVLHLLLTTVCSVYCI